MGHLAEYVALRQLIAENENALERMETKLENLKQNRKNNRYHRGFSKRKVKNYGGKLRKRRGKYYAVVQNLEVVIQKLLNLDAWTVESPKEFEAAKSLKAANGWAGFIIKF